MQVRYNPVVPIVFIVLGAGNFVLALALLQSGGSSSVFSLVVGPLLLLLGVLQLTRTYFEYETHTGTIVVKALVGPMARRFGGAGTLMVDGNRILWHRPDGQVKKVPVSKFMARDDQWRAVINMVR